MVVATRQCTRTFNGCIDVDESSEFAIKGGIAMKFIIFCLFDPRDFELTPDGEETFLDFPRLGKSCLLSFRKCSA